MFNSSKNKIFIEKNISEIKDLTRILFIDDEEMDLIDSLNSDGWRTKHIKDLDSFNNTDLIDSQIICVDIIGVGKKLKFKDEGLGLVKAIKQEYPYKKTILYSSLTTHNIFDNAIDMVDKKVYKDGQVYPFIAAIEELAKNHFNWNDYVLDIYNKYKKDFNKDIDFNEFNKKFKSLFSRNNSIDKDSVIKITGSSLSVAANIAQIMSLFIK